MVNIQKHNDLLPIARPRNLPRNHSGHSGNDMAAAAAAQLHAVRAILDNVMDPEIPVLSIAELGILQDVELQGDTIIVSITPTYSGCPAMTVVEEDIAQALATAGYSDFTIQHRLSPAWTSDRMSASAREKLRQYGIAPPCMSTESTTPACPRCGSAEVREISAFGSTACKALFQCRHCAETFDYFKPY
jgi:ring-1,2-phenylacetyl-CoA epoxidase subunit PaaD